MTDRTGFHPGLTAWLLALSIAALGVALGGCTRDDYYCDNTGCYYCDGVGCRAATPPARSPCHGDYECASGQICTSLGCTTHCRQDGDCPHGWVCRGGSGGDAGASSGVCVAPTESTPTPMPGVCQTNADCMSGTICLDGVCQRSSTPSCTRDTDCTGGQVCVASRCTAPADVCQFDNQCGQGRVCVNSQCHPACDATASCPTGEQCVAAGAAMYCAPPSTPTCGASAACPTGQRCLSGTCYQSCTPGASGTCGSTELYCSDDGVCVPDTRPRPFCDASHPCQSGSSCVGGVCRVPCTTDVQCAQVDVSYRHCGPIPNSTASGTYCLTNHEFRPVCARQSDCAMGQSCVDGSCQ